jgi:hypothetical protein
MAKRKRTDRPSILPSGMADKHKPLPHQADPTAALLEAVYEGKGWRSLDDEINTAREEAEAAKRKRYERPGDSGWNVIPDVEW